MAVLSPVWLLALLPWGAAALWLFQGRRMRVGVPYLPLWHGPVPLPRPKRTIRSIPLSVVMALLGTWLAIVAAAKPAVRGIGSRGGPPLVLIVDRGLSMSAIAGGQPRYVEAVRQFVEANPSDARDRPVELIEVPGDAPVHATLDECAARVASRPPTARDTRRALDDAIAGQLAGSRGPVWVLSDQPLRRDGRVIQVAPESVVRDVGIASLAARERPSPQVMVRVRNQSPIRAAALIVSAGEKTVRREIELPPAGEAGDYFINLPQLAAVLSARLDVQDDLKADDQAWLAREGRAPRIEVRAAVAPALQRLIEAYQRSRPAAGGESAPLPVVGSATGLPPEAPGVIVERAVQAAASGAVDVSEHAVTAHVSPGSLPAVMRVAGDSPAGWTPLVRIGGRCVVAARPDGPRQVWVGFDAPDWSATPDFVVFWTNVFDWTGGGGATLASHPLEDRTPQWTPTESAPASAGLRPGLYRRSDGALRAFNAPDVVFAPPPQTDWRARVAATRDGAVRLDLSPVLLILAAAAMALAAATWKRATRAPGLAQVPASALGQGSA